MFFDYLKRDDVCSFIKEIKNNDCYFNKDRKGFISHSLYMKNELALYIFYDALFKFKLIIQDEDYLSNYLDNLDRLYKKIDSFDGLEVGISKLICKMVSNKLNIKDISSRDSQREIIKYIYHYYVEEGYYIHGFNTSYSDDIKNNGFIPEIYYNYYYRFIELNKILKKYKLSMIGKDFSSNSVSFTDDFVLACYYSNYAPIFFYQFLLKNKIIKNKKNDYYLMDNYEEIMKNLKKFLSFHMINLKDREFIINLVNDQWDLLHRCPKKISLLFVKKRKMFRKEVVTLEDYLFDDKNIYEVVDRILNSKQKNMLFKDVIDPSFLEIVNLDYYYESNNNIKKEVFFGKELLNTYGSVSIMLLVGSLFITLGVIISIIMLLGE